MIKTIELALPEEFEDNIKRDMLKAAQEAFRATAHKYQYAEYMQRQTAAEYIGVAVSTLDKLTRQGLPTIIIDGLKLYRKASIDSYLLEHQI